MLNSINFTDFLYTGEHRGRRHTDLCGHWQRRPCKLDCIRHICVFEHCRWLYIVAVPPTDRGLHYCLHQLREIQPSEIRGEVLHALVVSLAFKLSQTVLRKSYFFRSSINTVYSVNTANTWRSNSQTSASPGRLSNIFSKDVLDRMQGRSSLI